MTLFLMWYDDSPKHSLADKLDAAREAYALRFGIAPTVALVNPADLGSAEIAGVRPAANVRPNIVWVGVEP